MILLPTLLALAGTAASRADHHGVGGYIAGAVVLVLLIATTLVLRRRRQRKPGAGTGDDTAGER